MVQSFRDRLIHGRHGDHIGIVPVRVVSADAAPAPITEGRMSARRHDRPSAVRVQVCDGCCCGTERKHPGVDHAGIRSRIAAAAEHAGGHVRIVGCVDECSRSNVVIVRPAGRASARTWIGGMLDDRVVGALCEWIRHGATSPAPPEIEPLIFTRTDDTDAAPTPTPVELRVSP